LQIATIEVTVVPIILLAFVGGLVSLLFMVPPGDSQFIGICLVGIGIVEILLHRMTGRRTFSWGRKMPFASSVWEQIGMKGAQLLYLGIGVSCTVFGVLFPVKSALTK
jgi:hypothetical protein